MSKSRLQRTMDYYHTHESRMGYRLILGGAKHFGYYPPGVKHLSMRQAMRLMEDQLGQAIGLPAGSRVLDAGCGMGRVATYLSKHYGYDIEGIDLLDFNIKAAKRFATAQGVSARAHFQIGDYEHIPLPDNSFDAVFTIETFVHAPHFQDALLEFYRVLKPGGRLVHFEYTVAPNEEMDAEARRVFQLVIEGAAMHALPHFTHGSFEGHLSRAGFQHVHVKDITSRMLPMLRRFSQMAKLSYGILRRTKISPKKYVNTLSAVEWYRHRKHFRFVVVTGNKPA